MHIFKTLFVYWRRGLFTHLADYGVIYVIVIPLNFKIGIKGVKAFQEKSCQRHKPSFIAFEILIRTAIRKQPDITLQELKDKFSLPVSFSALSKIIRNKLELCYKKQYTPWNSIGKMSR